MEYNRIESLCIVPEMHLEIAELLNRGDKYNLQCRIVQPIFIRYLCLPRQDISLGYSSFLLLFIIRQ